MQRAIKGGLNCIETYVFWNKAQLIPAVEPDFSDLVRFVEVAKELNLLVVLRIGPYVCAEWDWGGFPTWLLTIPNLQLRTYNEPYLTHMKTFIKQTLLAVNHLLAKKDTSGPIILLQIENEYGWLQSYYGQDGDRYAKWCADTANELEKDVPWIMCQQQDQPTVINTCNGFYCDNWIQEHQETFPNQPSLFTELWTGWFQKWGEPKALRPAEDLAFSVARWFQKGGSGINYYMYHGGTNFGRWAGGPLITTSYDYDAPLQEHGAPNEPKYSHLAKLHTILRDWESVILTSSFTTLKTSAHVEITKFGNDSAVLAFLSNVDLEPTTVQFEEMECVLPAWSTTLMTKKFGVWKRVYCTAEVPHTLLVVQSDALHNVQGNQIYRPTQISHKQENVPTNEPGDGRKHTRAQHLVEQIRASVGVSTDYMFQTHSFSTNSESVHVRVSEFYEYLYLYVDGLLCCSERGGNMHDAALNALDCTCPLQPLKHETHNVTLMSLTVGLDNIRSDMEQLTKGVLGNVLLDNHDVTNKEWLVVVGLQGEQLDYPKQHDHWKHGVTESGMTWYQFEFNLDKDNGLDEFHPFHLDLSSMNKGMIFVGGFMVGRYWNIVAEAGVDGKVPCVDGCKWQGAFSSGKCLQGCNKPSQTLYFVPRSLLFSENGKVVLFEEDAKNAQPEKVRLIRS